MRREYESYRASVVNGGGSSCITLSSTSPPSGSGAIIGFSFPYARNAIVVRKASTGSAVKASGPRRSNPAPKRSSLTCKTFGTKAWSMSEQ